MEHDFPLLYKYSLSEARNHDELELWKNSFIENVACKDAIENAIKQNFDGFTLKHDCASEIINQFGFLRTAWVLSATLQDKYPDGRFSNENYKWAIETYIPPCDRNREYIVQSHPAVLDGFIHDCRSLYNSLHLFDGEDCESLTGHDLRDKVLVLSPSVMKEICWTPSNQLWVAHGGFGCSPTASGRAVYATCLGDGEENVRWNRQDFIGILKDELLPDWARDQLHKLNSGQKIGPVDFGPTQVMHL